MNIITIFLRTINRRIFFQGLIIALVTGCAAHPGPVIDTKGADMTQYPQDLSECEAYAKQIRTEKGVAKGAVSGAIVGGLIGLIKGDAGEAAGVGAVTVGAKSAVKNQGSKHDVVKRCMQGRGYRVLN